MCAELILPGGKKVVVPCPSMVRDYQRCMGGVDKHDQLRLQRYSLQLSVVFRKYYKTIFLGLVDMATVNAYIIYREDRMLRNEEAADHAKFLRILQAQLLDLTAADFADMTMSPSPPPPSQQQAAVPSEHKLSVFSDWDHFGDDKKKRKWPQHQCKRKVGERSAGRFYCAACSTPDTFVYLCDRVKPNHYPGNTSTCFQIWHNKWKNGSERPRPLVGPYIQMPHFSRVTTDLYDRIRLAYQVDDNYTPLVQFLSDGKDAKVDMLSPRQRAQLLRYELADRLLHYSVDHGDTPRVVVPNDEDMKYEILLEAHDAPMSGHLGR
ncbi:Hypothetical protein PHPALM_9329 [Phytophthora palmivora]|uniref:PiggyBac transposable element-derived protein domain-containing protein n=1 Tax=Phytophthora palmivora TaxID=4796 RepID=A0A2P4Y7L2_9STRA|nr:Hypothetical protein PHPALM_9329 [Phytophthora palmivora]